MTTTILTAEQKDLARHALGLPNRSRKSYRNHFVTGAGSDDYEAWTDLVAKGLATRRAGNPITGGDDLFRLTRRGAQAALNIRETLDLEDFV